MLPEIQEVTEIIITSENLIEVKVSMDIRTKKSKSKIKKTLQVNKKSSFIITNLGLRSHWDFQRTIDQIRGKKTSKATTDKFHLKHFLHRRVIFKRHDRTITV